MSSSSSPPCFAGIDDQNLPESPTSSIIKEAIIPNSQQTQRSDGSSLGMFSQETRKNIENGEYLLPGLEDLECAKTLESMLSTEELAGFHQEEARAQQQFNIEKAIPVQEHSVSSSSPPPSTSPPPYTAAFRITEPNCRSQGLSRGKKRSEKMFSVLEAPPYLKRETDLLDAATKELDNSADTYTPGSQNNSQNYKNSQNFRGPNIFNNSQYYQNSILPGNFLNTQSSLNDTPISIQTTVLTQSFNGTYLPHYRPKNEQEKQQDEIRMREKKTAKLAMRKQEIDMTFEPFNNNNDMEVYEEVIDNSMDEEYPYDQPLYFNVQDHKRKAKDISAYASVMSEQNEVTLWAQSEKAIPFKLSWDRSVYDAKKFRLKFVRYNKETKRDLAIRMNLDVAKCRNCIVKETRIPHEAMFYVSKPSPANIDFVASGASSKIGRYHEADIPPGVTSIDFDITFACKEICWSVTEKRMSKILVVFLEDKDGRELAHSVINIRLVSYPQRDRRDSLEKKEKKARREQQRVADMLNQQQHLNNLQGKYAQMEYMDSFVSRKRPVTEWHEEPLPIQPVSSVPINHQTNLMLGEVSVYPPPNAQLKAMEEIIEDDNMPKRRKEEPLKIRHATFVDDDEYLNHLELRALLAQKRRYEADSSKKMSNRAIKLQEGVTEDTSIQKWLDTMDFHQYSFAFNHHNVVRVKDLIEKFENCQEFFQTLGLPSSVSLTMLDVFLNFYNIWKLPAFKRGLSMS